MAGTHYKCNVLSGLTVLGQKEVKSAQLPCEQSLLKAGSARRHKCSIVQGLHLTTQPSPKMLLLISEPCTLEGGRNLDIV